MPHPKTILVPVDFYDISKKALLFAAYIQRRTKEKIVVLHVSKTKNNEAELHQKLQPFISEAAIKPEDVIICIETGNVTDAIIAAQKKHRAGLIVMATQGANTIGRELIGTHTTAVINKTRCPVLVVPHKAKLKEVKTVVLATDNHRNTLEIAGAGIKLVKTLKAKLLVLHINAAMDPIAEVDYRLIDIPQKITRHIDYADMEMHVSSYKDIRKGIESFVSKHNAELLIMITRHRSIFESVFEKSHTRQMVFYSDVPMLVIPS